MTADPEARREDVEAAREIVNECGPTHEWAWCYEKPDTNCRACRLILRITLALSARYAAGLETGAKIAETWIGELVDYTPGDWNKALNARTWATAAHIADQIRASARGEGARER